MASSVITMQELEQSKVFVGDNKLMKFEHPLDYFQSFLDKFGAIKPEYLIQVEGGARNRDRGDAVSQNESFARVAITATLPSTYDVLPNVREFGHLNSQIGMVYALDTQKPTIKVFRGNRVTVCLNQTVFNSDNVVEILLSGGLSGLGTIYDKTMQYADSALGNVEEMKRIIENLESQKLSYRELMEHIGEIMIYAKKEKKLGVTPASDMISNITDPKSRYFIDLDKAINADRSINHNTILSNKWTTYNAITESLKKSSILDEATKVLLLNNVFEATM